MDLTDDVETLRNNETIFEPHLHHTRLFADHSPSDFGSEGRIQICAALAKILIKSSSTVNGKQPEDLKIVEDVAEVEDVKKAVKG